MACSRSATYANWKPSSKPFCDAFVGSLRDADCVGTQHYPPHLERSVPIHPDAHRSLSVD